MTAENNKIIAEFIGWIYDEGLESYRKNNKGKFYYILLSNLNFYSDWNLLMEVVERIEKLSKNNRGILHWSRNNWTIFDILITSAKKEVVYSASLEFINWYNKNNP